VGVIFRPVPGHALADIHLERRWRNRDGLLEGFLCFLDPADLAERRGEPPICVWGSRMARFAAAIAAS